MTELSSILRDAVPEPPPLHGLGAAAAARARVVRRRRRLGTVAVSVLAVACIVGGGASLLSGSTPVQHGHVVPPATQATAPAGRVVAGCPTTTARHQDLTTGHVVSVGFCQGVEARSPAAVSTHLLTGDPAAALVDHWRDDATTEAVVHGCGPMIGTLHHYAIEITYDDGTVTQVGGNTDDGCDSALFDGRYHFSNDTSAFDDLTHDIAEQQAAAYPFLPLPTLGCPSTASDLEQSDGASAKLLTDDGPILELPSIGGVLCSYRFTGHASPRTIDSDLAEKLRIAASHAFEGPRRGEPIDHGPPAPIMQLRLRDQTGTVRVITLDDGLIAWGDHPRSSFVNSHLDALLVS